MKRLTLTKLDGILFQVLYALDSEDVSSADREQLLRAGELVDELRSRLFGVDPYAEGSWRKTERR